MSEIPMDKFKHKEYDKKNILTTVLAQVVFINSPDFKASANSTQSKGNKLKGAQRGQTSAWGVVENLKLVLLLYYVI